MLFFILKSWCSSLIRRKHNQRSICCMNGWLLFKSLDLMYLTEMSFYSIHYPIIQTKTSNNQIYISQQPAYGSRFIPLHLELIHQGCSLNKRTSEEFFSNSANLSGLQFYLLFQIWEAILKQSNFLLNVEDITFIQATYHKIYNEHWNFIEETNITVSYVNTTPDWYN